jgi:hypothetical protein
MAIMRGDFAISESEMHSLTDVYSAWMINLSVSNNVITSTNGDPQIYLKNKKNIMVRFVIIDVKLISADETAAQIFYLKDEYNESDSVRFTLKDGKNTVLIPPGRYREIRLDLTSSDNFSMIINSVSFTNKQNINQRDIMVILLWGILCLVCFYYSNIKNILNKKNSNIKIEYRIVCFIMLSGVIVFFMDGLYYLFMNAVLNKEYSSDLNVERWIIFAPIAMLISGYCVVPRKHYFSNIFKYRYIIAAVLFILSIIFEFHGSNITWYNAIQPHIRSKYSEPVIGVTQNIQTDEFLGKTPLILSQEYNHYNSISNIPRGADTNVYFAGTAPAKNYLAVFRPFYWGFFFLGSSRGLAWYSAGGFLALLLISFEFFRVITGDNRKLSLLGSVLISLAPLVLSRFFAWSINELFISGFLALIAFKYYLQSSNLKIKLLCSIVIGYCGSMYFLCFYPPFQIPLFYLLLVLAIYLSLENISYIKNIYNLIIILSLIIIGVTVLYWYITSKDVLLIEANTIYPGSRRVRGGNSGNLLFHYMATLVYLKGYYNTFEISSFWGFFPFTEVFAIIYLFKKDKKDNLVKMLLFFNFIVLIFLLFGFPSFIGRITLFDRIPPIRIYRVLLLSDVIIFIRILSKTNTALVKNKINRNCIFILFGFSIFVILNYLSNDLQEAISPKGLFPLINQCIHGAIIMIFCALFLFKRNDKIIAVFCSFLIILSIFSAVTLFPITRKIDVIREKPAAIKIRQIQKETPGLWLAGDIYLSQFLIANSAPTINSHNDYPNLELWKKLDHDNKYAEIYNRNAHIHVSFLKDNDKDMFEYGVNQFKINLLPQDIRTLNVDYIVVRNINSIPADSDWQKIMELIYEEDGVYIFKVNKSILSNSYL